MVGWDDSKHPPWSTEMSTSTEPGFILATSSSETSFGALAPTTSTAPMTMSASTQVSSIAWALDAMVSERATEVVVDGPQLREVAVEHVDIAVEADGQRRRRHPGDPGAEDHDLGRADARAPRRRAPRSRRPAASGGWRPTIGAIRPATSLIGMSSGREPSGSCTVS